MDHNFKKKFGQNFINDQNIIQKIVNSINIDRDTLVIEIGPGAGALTGSLLKEAGSVIAYEIDQDLQSVLNKKFRDCERLELIFEDFLERDVTKDIQKYKYKKIYVVANIPYYITTPIIKKIIEISCIDKVVIMIQKEVGERFCALPGSRSYGSMTVYLNYYFQVNKLFVVNRNNFIPKPNVDSIVITLERKPKRNDVKDEELLLTLIRDSFQFKRKNLRNNLKQYPLEKIEQVLEHYQLDLTVRAEMLPLEIFIDISNHL